MDSIFRMACLAKVLTQKALEQDCSQTTMRFQKEAWAPPHPAPGGTWGNKGLR